MEMDKKLLRVTLELLDDLELKSIGIPAGIGQGTGLGLRERDRDGIGLRLSRLRASIVFLPVLILRVIFGPF